MKDLRLVNKLKRRNKALNRNRGFRRQDKIDKRDETLRKSPRAYKLMSEIQQREDRNFGQQLNPSPEKNPNRYLMFADLDGTATIPAVEGVAASFSGQVAGMTEDVTIVADNEGVAGNSISLSFDGSDDIDTVLAAWNLANPSNQATLTEGDGSQIPDNLETIDLAGGVDAEAEVPGELEMSVAAGLMREARVVEGSIVQVLSGDMKGMELSVLSVDYDADTAELEFSTETLDGTESDTVVKVQLSGTKTSYR